MKRKIIFLIAIIVNLVAVSKVNAEPTSNSSISLTDGSGLVSPPLDPKNPSNPIPESPIDPLDADNDGTGSEGPLSIDYVSNLTFGEQKISGSDMTFYAKNLIPYVQVTDTRGTGAGWTIQACISDFTSSDKKSILKGAQFILENPILKSASESNQLAAPSGYASVALNPDKKTVLSSVEGAGKGTWLMIFPAEKDETINKNIILTVPAGSPEANTTYSATVRWELLDGPK